MCSAILAARPFLIASWHCCIATLSIHNEQHPHQHSCWPSGVTRDRKAKQLDNIVAVETQEIPHHHPLVQSPISATPAAANQHQVPKLPPPLLLTPLLLLLLQLLCCLLLLQP
jgi:hypothetical protein